MEISCELCVFVFFRNDMFLKKHGKISSCKPVLLRFKTHVVAFVVILSVICLFVTSKCVLNSLETKITGNEINSKQNIIEIDSNYETCPIGFPRGIVSVKRLSYVEFFISKIPKKDLKNEFFMKKHYFFAKKFGTIEK